MAMYQPVWGIKALLYLNDGKNTEFTLSTPTPAGVALSESSAALYIGPAEVGVSPRVNTPSGFWDWFNDPDTWSMNFGFGAYGAN